MLLFTFFLLRSNAIAQPYFSRADSMGIHFDGSFVDIPDLARKLTRPFDNDVEKFRVLYAWVAHHISFDVAKYENPPQLGRFVAKSEKELQWKNQEKLNRELVQTLNYRKGVCQDYSNLYRALCRAIGLECLTVTGLVRDFFKPSRASHNQPHTWNVVKVDGQWQFLDATWGAGYVMNGRFVQEFSPGYFMTPPAWFVQSHLPNLAEWQLLEKPIGKWDFLLQPLVNFGQKGYPLLDFSQKMEKSPDGLAQLRFRFSDNPTAFLITNGRTGETIPFTHTIEDGWVVLRFSSFGLKQVTVYMGEDGHATLGWLGKYEMK